LAPRGYTVGVIAGDGIGPEVVAEARTAAEAAGVAPPPWALQPIPDVRVIGPQIAAPT
jgi:hypothetical protein